MEEELLISEQAKGIVLFVMAYLCLRVSRYGMEKIDQRVMQISGVIILLTLAVYFITRSSELLASIFLVALGWGMVVMWFGKVPGLRLQFPEGGQRTALLVEFLAIGLAALLVISFWF